MRLLQERERLGEALERKMETARNSLTEMTEELSAYDQHPGDLGSETFEREKDAGLQELIETQLVKVNDALSRLSNGNYGICELCGQRIDPLRLERLPSANLCISCATKSQDRFPRPQEEEILDMHEIEAKGGEFTVAGYDLFDEFGLNDSGAND